MKQIAFYIPLILPWILFLLFVQPLFLNIEFSVDSGPDFLYEIGEEKVGEVKKESIWSIRKGIFHRLGVLKTFIEEMQAVSIPGDGFPKDTYERLNRILFGEKLTICFVIFLVLLCISGFLSWIYQAWFRNTLNKILYWAGILYAVYHMFAFLPHAPFSGFGLVLVLFYTVLILFLIWGIRILNQENSKSVRFEVLKHTSELDEEGRRPPIGIPWSPLRVGYHFAIIILVGLAVGNLVYLPLFLLQKHFAYEFGILIAVFLAGLCAFYIRNYSRLSDEKEISKLANISVSFAYLQYKFLKNLGLGIGAMLIIIFFVSILFSILFLNADLLKSPALGIIEKSAEF